jgi:FXSXX-COOH protein
VRREDRENIVTFESDVIDLSGIDLAALSEVPSAALRAAILRVRAELSGHGDQSAAYAGFRSSLPTKRQEDQDLAGSDPADEDTDALR